MRKHLVMSIGLAVCCLAAAGCQLKTIVPAGSGTVRYRDDITSSVDVTKGVAYGKAADLTGAVKTLKLDVYQPHGDTVTKRAAVVWVHGGSFKGGSKDDGEIVDQATVFTKKGYVVVSIDYRLSAGGCAPFTSDCIKAIEMAYHDAQAAVRFLRAKATTYGIDTNRIAVAGTSAGAITAYNVAYGSEIPGHSGNPGYSSKVRAAVSLSGASLTTTPNAGEPPTLDFHGTKDDLVPYEWVQSTVKDAKAAGLVAEQTVWPGDGHVPYDEHRQQILDETRNFLYAAMDLAHAAT